MPRMAIMVFMCGLGLSLPASAPAAGAPKLVVAQAAGDSNAGPAKESRTKPEKAPARQVPVEPVELSADQYDKEAFEDQAAGPGAGGEEKPAEEKSPGSQAGDGGGMSREKKTAPTATAEERETIVNAPSAGAPAMQPGLPARKPPKPVIKHRPADRNSAKKRSSMPAREKKLCKALQTCRNEFVRCRNKIKHADQSEAWIIAKEVCGTHYKTCVEKDFQSGEWFFTRWFYFKDLDCK